MRENIISLYFCAKIILLSDKFNEVNYAGTQSGTRIGFYFAFANG